MAAKAKTAYKCTEEELKSPIYAIANTYVQVPLACDDAMWVRSMSYAITQRIRLNNAWDVAHRIGTDDASKLLYRNFPHGPYGEQLYGLPHDITQVRDFQKVYDTCTQAMLVHVAYYHFGHKDARTDNIDRLLREHPEQAEKIRDLAYELMEDALVHATEYFERTQCKYEAMWGDVWQRVIVEGHGMDNFLGENRRLSPLPDFDPSKYASKAAFDAAGRK